MNEQSKEQVIQDNLEFFIEHHPEIYKAYAAYGKLIHEKGPLDEKMRWLIKVAVTTTGQNRYALVTHIRKALRSGCTPAEIEHAILLTAPSAGFPVMMEGLLDLRRVMAEAVDKHEE